MDMLRCCMAREGSDIEITMLSVVAGSYFTQKSEEIKAMVFETRL